MGFIGQHCLEHYRAAGHEVWGCDVLPGYSLPRYYRAGPADDPFGYIFEEQDIDLCINCSGAANVQESIAQPLRDYQLNTHNVLLLLEAMRRHRPDCRLINLSSAAVYGNPQALPVGEQHPTAPLSPYGYHKLHADLLCEEYARNFGIKSISLRIFSAYGPGLRKQLFWDLYQKTQAAQSLELFGSGQESRDFIYITDLIRAIDCVQEKAAFDGGCVNVASGVEVTIAEAVAAFTGAIGWEGEYRFSGKARAGDPDNWQADITLLQSFGFKPKHTIQTGLQALHTWLSTLP